MSASQPCELIQHFASCFNDKNLDGLLALYETDAIMPSEQGDCVGLSELREVLGMYLDADASLEFQAGKTFIAGDIALMLTPWTMTNARGFRGTGVSVIVSRRQADGSWKYLIDNPGGLTLLGNPSTPA